MRDALTPNAPLTYAPNSVTSARVLLVIWCLASIFGVVGHARRFLGGANPGGDLLALNWSLGLAVASGFAFWAIGRRRPIGRWIAVGVFGLVIARSLASFFYALRAVLGDLESSAGMVAFSSRSEGSGALVSQAIVIAVLGLQIYLLARGTLANRYFDGSGPARLIT